MLKKIRFIELEKEYKQAKEELNSEVALDIIQKYNTKLNLKKSDILLSEIYSPTYAVLKYYFKNFKNKRILEIGFSSPYFLEFLKLKGFKVNGIDIEPLISSKEYLKMSIEKIDKDFLTKNMSKFDVITSRISLSKLYNENFEVKTGSPAYRNPHEILKNISKLLNKNGILILQEDRGSIFTEKDFFKNKFKCLVKPYPIVFYNTENKYDGWNVISAYVLE
jgi:SAM-dependent methyltransferase